MMIAENWMNDVAVTLGKEPSFVRYTNLFREGQKAHYTQIIEENALERCWNECLKQSQYEQSRQDVNEFNVRNKWKKRGVCIIPTMFGISFAATFLNQGGKMLKEIF